MTKKHRDDVDQLFVVVRIDGPPHGQDAASVHMAVKLVEAVPTLDEAEAEVKRLSAVNAGKPFEYFVQSVRHFPDGRRVAPARDELSDDE